MDNALGRLLVVIVSGSLLLGAILGSIWLSQADAVMTQRRPAPGPGLATPTLYPTLPPATAATVATPDDPTPAVTRTGEPSPTASPSSDQACAYPTGWLPYQLRAGDNLYVLAQQARTNLQALLQGNCLTSIHDLTAGDVIYLPPIVFASPTPVATRCGPPPTWRVIRVSPGDTLYRLAVRYGTTVAALRQANCLQSDTLYVGQPLFVPPTIVVSPTPTSSPTATASPTVSPTVSLTPSATPSSTPSPTLTPVLTPTITTTPTATPVVTVTATLTATPTPATPTPTPTATTTPDITSTSTPTPTLTPTETPPATDAPTATPSNTPAPPEAPTDTPAPTATNTPTA